MAEIRRKRLLHQCFLCGEGAVFPVRVEAERACFHSGSGNCWAMVHTLDVWRQSAPAADRHSRKQAAQRKKNGKRCLKPSQLNQNCSNQGLSATVVYKFMGKAETRLKTQKIGIKWETANRTRQDTNRTGVSGWFRTAPAPPAEPGRDTRTEKTAHDQGGGR
jgi:hypothetical protein